MTKMQHDIPQLDRKGLREFALLTGGIIAVLFGLFFPWLLNKAWPLWPWVIAGILSVWGLTAPLSLQPVYRGWMKLGLQLSRITTPLILGIVFYGLITPMGLIMRMTRHDPMSRRIDAAADSYRVKHDKPPRKNVERPF